MRALLREQVELKLVTDRFEEAVHDCDRLVSLWRGEPNASTEVASAESLYARACLEVGDYDQAALVANQALNSLIQWQHPDALRCQVTLALANWQNRDPVATSLSEAKTQIETAKLLTPVEKGQFFEEEAKCLQKHSRFSEAEDFRRSSETQIHAVAETQVSVAFGYM